MYYARPEFSRSEIDKAGEVLRTGGSSDWNGYVEAFIVLNNWRSSHAFPLNTITVSLKKHARLIDSDSLVAQRLKRVPSITEKLRRESGMSLARMQDIGGCRAVMPSIAQVYELADRLRKSSMKHELKRYTNYIEKPKASGYRGVHLIYRYNSDRNEVYNKHRIEVQIRSQVQHAWATAVETVGTFLRQSLKASEGPEDWLRFFRTASEAFAYMEGVSLGADRHFMESLFHKTLMQARQLDVARKLSQYGDALRHVTGSESFGAAYYLMTLRPEFQTLVIESFLPGKLQEATEKYLAAEQELREVDGAEVVLVAAESVQTLRRAYPNYFLDTDLFVSNLAALEEFLPANKR